MAKTNSGEYLVVTAPERKTNSSLFNIRRVFLFNVSGDRVTGGRIFEFLGHNYNVSDNLEKLIADAGKPTIEGFDGEIYEYDINYRDVRATSYVDGKKSTNKVDLKAEKAIKFKSKETSLAVNSLRTNTVDYDFSSDWPWWLADDCTIYYTVFEYWTNNHLDAVYFRFDWYECPDPEVPTSSGSGSGSASLSQAQTDPPPYGGSGTGGGGGIPSSITITIDGVKVNPTEELKCFDKTKPATMTVYIQQPTPNTRAMNGQNSMGHVFIGITQDGITRNVGFYPNSISVVIFGEKPSEIHDNSGSLYHVSLTKPISSTQLTNVINYVTNYPPNYSLRSYNCTDFGIGAANQGGLTLPATVGSHTDQLTGVTFTAHNPGDLGQDIRNWDMNDHPGIVRHTGTGTAPTRVGGCQ